MIIYTLLTSPLQIIKQKRQLNNKHTLLSLFNGIEVLSLINTHLLFIDTDYPLLTTTLAKCILSPFEGLYTLQSLHTHYQPPIKNIKLYWKYLISIKCIWRHTLVTLVKVGLGLVTELVLEGCGLGVYDDTYRLAQCFGLVLEVLVSCPLEMINSCIDYQSTIGNGYTGNCKSMSSKSKNGMMESKSKSESDLKMVGMPDDCIEEDKEENKQIGFIECSKMIYMRNQTVDLDGLDETEIQLLDLNSNDGVWRRVCRFYKAYWITLVIRIGELLYFEFVQDGWDLYEST